MTALHTERYDPPELAKEGMDRPHNGRNPKLETGSWSDHEPEKHCMCSIPCAPCCYAREPATQQRKKVRSLMASFMLPRRREGVDPVYRPGVHRGHCLAAGPIFRHITLLGTSVFSGLNVRISNTGEKKSREQCEQQCEQQECTPTSRFHRGLGTCYMPISPNTMVRIPWFPSVQAACTSKCVQFSVPV